MDTVPSDGAYGVEVKFIISEEALTEKRQNWHEIYGVAAGYAAVKHPDWQAIYDYMQSHHRNPDFDSHPNWPGSYLVAVVLPNGEAAHMGGITKRHGMIQLDG